VRRVRFSPQALQDIELVAAYGIEQFGAAQAELYQDEMFKQFDLLAEYPRLGLMIAHPSRELYRFGYGSHVIIYSIYSIEPESLTVRRILHGRMDVLRHV
jgi:plasmid stabilization system protein ParE